MLCPISGGQIHLDSKGLVTQRVVASRTNSIGSKAVITVNRDDAVHKFDRNKGDNDFIIAANLGTRIRTSGNLNLEQVLPKEDIPVAAKRVAFPDGVTVHVILAWGFSSVVPETLEAYCKLFVIREELGKTERMIEEELGTQLKQFIVEDLGGDGKYEVLVSTREGSADTMDVWQIYSRKITKIQTIGGYEVSTISDRFMDSGFEVLVQEKADEPSPDKICYSATLYKWSAQHQKFIEEGK